MKYDCFVHLHLYMCMCACSASNKALQKIFSSHFLTVTYLKTIIQVYTEVKLTNR